VLQRSMYSNPHGAMPPPQSRSVAPETFLLDQDAQQSLPPDSIVALQQVDNRMCSHQRQRRRASVSARAPTCPAPADRNTVKYFLISAPVDWQPDQYIRRFLLPTGEYVSCVLW
jgi:transcription factor STE12